MAEKKVSYLKEMLFSQGNFYALLGSAAAGALLSIPFGFAIGALPLVLFAAGESIAAMYLPASITFRDQVDRKFRRQARLAVRHRLLQEISERGHLDDAVFDDIVRVSEQMQARIQSLYAHAEDSRTALTLPDVERLEDAAIDYLRVRLAITVIKDRASRIHVPEIEKKISLLDQEMAQPKPGTDIRQLNKARVEYQGMIERFYLMHSRRQALEAVMLSMPDQVEEIYQAIMTSSGGTGSMSRLSDAIDRLRVQENLEAELESDLGDSFSSGSIANPATGKPQLRAVSGRHQQHS